jgi:hypothetical protein
MKRKKRELEAEISRLTEGNAEWMLSRYTKRSCRGGVCLFFDIVPGAVLPEAIVRHCLTDKDGRPELLMMSTKGRVKDGKIEAFPVRRQAGEELETINFPIAAISDTISVTWHEWV